jgi:phage-related minor tail protein
MLRSQRGAVLILTLVLASGCDQGYGPTEGSRIEAEDVGEELKEAAKTTGEYISQEWEMFTRESRAKIEEWRSSLREASETRASTGENEFRERAEEVQKKINVFEKNLDDLNRSSR